jgi:hypothetical protein
MLLKYAWSQIHGVHYSDYLGSLRTGFSADSYWSSSEVSGTGAWVRGFDGGYQGIISKPAPNRVRPVRAF